MKKNKMLRIASILLVVTLLSTCVISGTFAKYVTKAEGKDEARVAKWGVLISMSGDSVFSEQYAAEDESYIEAGGEYSVLAEADEEGNRDKVVAPGTKLDGLVATVAGKPEVATRYELTITGLKDIVLPAGTYTDYTEILPDEDNGYAYNRTFTTSEDYHPVLWDLVISSPDNVYKLSEELANAFASNPNLFALAQQYGLKDNGCSLGAALKILDRVANGNNGDGYQEIVDVVLGNIVKGGRNFQLEILKNEGEIDGLKMSYDFDPNKDMHYAFNMTWNWLFDETKGAELKGTIGDSEEEVNVVDQADTLLGNLIALKLDGSVRLGGELDEAGKITFNELTELPLAEGASAPEATLEIGANFIASATQID